MFITLDVDEEEYPIPADGRVGEELEDGIRDQPRSRGLGDVYKRQNVFLLPEKY